MTFQDDYSYEYNFERFYGAYILDLRKEYAISQKELAKILHISNSTLSKNGIWSAKYGFRNIQFCYPIL